MIVPTHILMGRTIERFIAEALPVRLNRRWFLYGNIYPDISHYLFTIPHFASHSMGFVKRLIRTLCRTPIDSSGRIDPIMSLQIGMLCHYICDFFCHAHSDSFHGSKKAHLAYELRQQVFFTRRPNGLRGALSEINTGELPADIEMIWQWLEAEQAKYVTQHHTPITDLKQAVEKSSLVASSVLALCLGQAWASQTLPIPVAV